jgi:hypothetical protein
MELSDPEGPCEPAPKARLSIGPGRDDHTRRQAVLVRADVALKRIGVAQPVAGVVAEGDERLAVRVLAVVGLVDHEVSSRRQLGRESLRRQGAASLKRRTRTPRSRSGSHG